jgi:RHS repeat-associated protein
MNLFGNGLVGRVEANNGVINASGSKRYYIADLLGSVRAVVDETGDVKENRDYDPWGVPMDQRQYLQGGQALEQFSGQELDDETGWYHFGQRDLMAVYGRWPSPDRFADKYPSLSPYSYAANDPIGFVDVNGDSVVVAFYPVGGDLSPWQHAAIIHMDE